MISNNDLFPKLKIKDYDAEVTELSDNEILYQAILGGEECEIIFAELDYVDGIMFYVGFKMGQYCDEVEIKDLNMEKLQKLICVYDDDGEPWISMVEKRFIVVAYQDFMKKLGERNEL